MKRISKYRSNGIRVVKFNIGHNNYDKTMIYYKNGNPKMERNYKNGDLDGNLISYWENGIVHTRGQYKNNKRIGTWNTFDKKGNVIFGKDPIIFASKVDNSSKCTKYIGPFDKKEADRETGIPIANWISIVSAIIPRFISRTYWSALMLWYNTEVVRVIVL